jgi:hypothetical protein
VEWVIVANIILTAVGLGWIEYRARRNVATVPAITSPVNPHRLVKIWDNRSCDHNRQGWWFECSCGLKRQASDVTKIYLGSEKGAMDTYKSHAALYKGLAISEPAINPFEKKYNDEVAAFKEYRDKCFCKDTNDDLLLLKHRHP